MIGCRVVDGPGTGEVASVFELGWEIGGVCSCEALPTRLGRAIVDLEASLLGKVLLGSLNAPGTY